MPTPYGSWPSPISAELVAAGGVSLGGPALRVDAEGLTEVWWSEQRPTEGGRVALVRRLPGADPSDQIEAPYSARSRVHEYGGGAWFLGERAVYFANADDQRLYRFVPDTTPPEPITPEPPNTFGWRYADGEESPDGRWIVAVREDHTTGGAEPRGHMGGAEPRGHMGGAEPRGHMGGAEPRNELVVIAADGSEAPRVLHTGPDFVMAPRVSPDGRWLAWIQWDHPNMPWDGTELCVAPLFDGFRLGNIQIVAGALGRDGVSAISPGWTSDGRLVFSDDRSGWWNLYAWSPAAPDTVALTTLDGSEIGYPPWVFGLQPWVELPDGRLVAVETEHGVDRLVIVSDGEVEPLGTPYVSISGLAASDSGELVVVAQTEIDPPAVVEIASNGEAFEHRPPDALGVDPRWFSVAEPFEFDSAGGRRIHAFFYPPTGADMSGPSDELPPLVVVGHGGPTAHANPALGLKVQYWTSRGFAVVDVNYGGSSGHGRAYRRLLEGRWGIVDVEDCVAAASALADAGKVDRDRLAFRGSSAGGFTVLAALATTDVFSAGVSLYGIGDLEALARDTHKFEARYPEGLIGPYPEQRELYVERSPLSRIEGFSCPMLILQGTEDEIVPPNQAEAMLEALAAKGIAHGSIFFEGEQHGFRQAPNVIRSLEAELWFYGRVFGFEPADAIDPVEASVGL